MAMKSLKGFLDDQGNFIANIHKDIKGMLSLYEASHLDYEGEEILDMARKQTSMYLKHHLGNLDSVIVERVGHALEVPFKREDANPILLEPSKLDFNMVQSVLQRDLQDMSRKAGYVGYQGLEEGRATIGARRGRMYEGRNGSGDGGLRCEGETECLSHRVLVVEMETGVSFSKAGARKKGEHLRGGNLFRLSGWEEKMNVGPSSGRPKIGLFPFLARYMRNLGDHMKLCFLAVYNAVNEMEYDHFKEQGEDALPYLTKAWADLCKSFLQEAKWSYNKITPSFDEYLENA
ncbi:unnamed protein product [Dovyalis caffra]|uniref:Uncharacterized protein n=1 Tax=Dovyalis caffra TaxID=77055 RepID=A0AAV1SQN2_9ROSI|nr:unnamed protein product [Dovyalis caffra]